MKHSTIKLQIIQLSKRRTVLSKRLNEGLKKLSFWVSAFFVFLLILPSAQVVASSNVLPNADITPVKHSEVWQSMIESLPKEQGVFNRALRESVREVLPLEEISNIEVVDSDFYQQRLAPKLQELDKSLKQFVRVSQSQSSFRQLEKLMPALFAIEEYKLIKDLFKQQNMVLPPLSNARLVGFLDRRITQLANHMIFNMKALVRERRPFEGKLLKAMASYGVEYSAKPPDFILDYDIDFEQQNAAGEWTFNTSIALLNEYQVPIVKVDELVVTEAIDEQSAQQQALEVMAKLVTMQLRHVLLKNK